MVSFTRFLTASAASLMATQVSAYIVDVNNGLHFNKRAENSSSSDSLPTSSESSSTPIPTSGSGADITSTVTESDVSTTLVTITSCDEGTCSEAVVPTGVTVVTAVVHGVVTSYTTYCPITTETAGKGKPGKTTTVYPTGKPDETHVYKKTGTEGAYTVTEKIYKSKAVSTVTYVKDESKTVYVTTTVEEITETVVPTVAPTTIETAAPTTVETVAPEASTVATVSTFEGAGQRLVVGSSLVAFVCGLLFI
jgi:hypothetical protein